MVSCHRSQIILASATVCALVALPALALAQARVSDVECRTTETQAECHTRLKCKSDEELEACQARLLKCRADEELDDCKKRRGAGRADEGRDDAARRREGRDADASDRDRDRDDYEERADRRQREDDDRERGDRRGRGDDDRDRGDRRGGKRRGDRGRRRGGGGGTHGFEANKTFGLGVELGEPAGLNGKYFVSESGALDFGLGWIYRHYYYGDGIHLYGDFLWHPTSLVSTPAFELPFYIGAGLRFWDFDYCVQQVCTYDGSAIGVRVPLGVAFDFNNVPLDLFVQVVPVIDFLDGDYYDRYRDRNHFGIDASFGLRYWFQ